MTVPALVSSNPTNHDTDVEITQVVSFTFNTAIDATSVKKGTVFLYIESTGDPIECNLQVDDATIYLHPVRALFEDVTYIAVCMGESSGASAGNVKSADGDDLPDNVLISFTTQVEQYATREQVEQRADVETDGLIREVDLTEVGGLELTEVTPLGFSTDLDPSELDEVVFEFSANIDINTLTGNITLEAQNVWGDEDLYGAVANSDNKVYLQEWEPGTGECDFSQPTGEFTLSDNTITWTRGTGEPEFNHNTQVIFKINQDLKDVNGHSLVSDAVVSMTTEFFPKYQTVQIMRSICGPMIADQYDDAINRILHRVSLDAFEIAGYKFDPYSPYPAVKRYVRYASILELADLLNARQSIYAGQRKTLGDLTIEYPNSLPDVDVGLVGRSRKKLERLERELRYYRGQGRPEFITKGISAGDRRTDRRSRRWDIEYEYGSLFYAMTNVLVPASNLKQLRQAKLGYAHDAHPHNTGSKVSYYTNVNGTAGLFTSPKPS